jgi:hypothetical protein
MCQYNANHSYEDKQSQLPGHRTDMCGNHLTIVEIHDKITMYRPVFLSHHLSAGQNHSIKTVEKSFRNVAELMFWNNTGKSKLLVHVQRNYIKFAKCLLTSESFIIPSSVCEPSD